MIAGHEAAKDIFARADMALYAVKEHGRNGFLLSTANIQVVTAA